MNTISALSAFEMLIVITVMSLVVITAGFFIALRYSKAKATTKINTLQNDMSMQLAELNHRHDSELRSVQFQLEKDISLKDSKIESLLDVQKSHQQEIARLSSLEADHIKISTQFEQQKESLERQAKLLEETKTQLFKEFELSAAKLYEEKQKNFNTTSKQSVESVINPFKEQIQAFYKRVETVYDNENNQRNQLIGQITELKKQASRISDDANNLAAALKGDNKMQGGWGEIVLERLLEESGLEKGREYETQGSYKSEDGRIARPDVVIHLPEEKDIVIDAKVSLVHYERYVSETENETKEKNLKLHIDSIRTHVKGLSLKQYEQLEGIKTLDFVFLFIPIEGAYILALQQAPQLFKEAYDKNIILASPSSLMVVLRTVESIWRYKKQNDNAEEIASSAGKLYDQFVLFVESMEKVGAAIDRAGSSYEQAIKRLSTGKGNLLNRIDSLKQLGAKTNKSLSLESLDVNDDIGKGEMPELNVTDTPNSKTGIEKPLKEDVKS